METDVDLLDERVCSHSVGNHVYLPAYLFIIFLDEMARKGINTDRSKAPCLYIWKNRYVDLHPDPNYV
jgi:hypothetical protein